MKNDSVVELPRCWYERDQEMAAGVGFYWFEKI